MPHDIDQVALIAARQALHEFSTSAERSDTLKCIVREAVAEALGVPFTSQEDRTAIRKDMLYLRAWRENMETVRAAGISAAVKWLVVGVLTLLAVGIGYKFGG